MKLRKNKPWWIRIAEFINEFKLLQGESSFNWSFFKYWWRIKVVNTHDSYTIENDNGTLLMLMLIKKNVVEKYITLLYVIGNETNLTNVNVIQSLKTALLSYNLVGYNMAYLDLASVKKKTIKPFVKYLFFEESTAKSLLHLVKDNNQSTIYLFRSLTH